MKKCDGAVVQEVTREFFRMCFRLNWMMLQARSSSLHVQEMSFNWHNVHSTPQAPHFDVDLNQKQWWSMILCWSDRALYIFTFVFLNDQKQQVHLNVSSLWWYIMTNETSHLKRCGEAGVVVGCSCRLMSSLFWSILTITYMEMQTFLLLSIFLNVVLQIWFYT